MVNNDTEKTVLVELENEVNQLITDILPLLKQLHYKFKKQFVNIACLRVLKDELNKIEDDRKQEWLERINSLLR